MSHLPNKLQSASEHIIGSNRTIFAGQAVKMVSDGIAAIDLTADELSLMDITEQNLQKVLCTIAITHLKHLVIYANLSTNVGCAVIHNISNGVITPASTFNLTDAIYKAQGYKISNSKFCILLDLVSTQKIIVLNVDGSDNITLGSSITESTDKITVFEKINDTKFICGQYDKAVSFNLNYKIKIGTIDVSDVITFVNSLTFSAACEYTILSSVLSDTRYCLTYYNSYNDQTLKTTLLSINVNDISQALSTITIQSFYQTGNTVIIGSVLDSKKITSEKILLATSKTENYSNYYTDKTYLKILTITNDTLSETTSYIYSPSYTFDDLKTLVTKENKFIVQRITQKPTNIEVFTIDHFAAVSKTAQLELTENNAILFKALDVYGTKIIEYTLQQGNKTSLKIINTTQNVPDNILGFAKQNGTSGQKTFVDNGYEIGGFFGLLSGNIYYLGDNGQIIGTQEQTSNKIGVAITSNKIKRLF